MNNQRTQMSRPTPFAVASTITTAAAAFGSLPFLVPRLSPCHCRLFFHVLPSRYPYILQLEKSNAEAINRTRTLSEACLVMSRRSHPRALTRDRACHPALCCHPAEPAAAADASGPVDTNSISHSSGLGSPLRLADWLI